MRAFLIAAAAVAAGAVPALGQPRPVDPTVRVSLDVVVTPDRGDSDRLRVPADLPTLPVAHAGEALVALPGFTVMRPQVHAGRPIVSARGFFGDGEAEYVPLLIDGVPVADVESGRIDWARIAVSSIERVEAARGPAAALFGDAAIDGVIQIFTRPQASSARASALAGSLGAAVGDASIARGGGSGGFILSGAGGRAEGPFDHSSSRQLTVNGAADVETPAWRWRPRRGRRHAPRRTGRDPADGARRARTLDATAVGGSIDAVHTLAASRALRRATVDVRVRRAWDCIALVADIFNATERRYAEYGFTLADFASRTVGYVHPGAPRAWRVGFTTAF